jgi:hypothetical protein
VFKNSCRVVILCVFVRRFSDFSGQSSRLLMLEEMGNIIKTAATDGTQS